MAEGSQETLTRDEWERRVAEENRPKPRTPEAVCVRIELATIGMDVWYQDLTVAPGGPLTPPSILAVGAPFKFGNAIGVVGPLNMAWSLREAVDDAT